MNNKQVIKWLLMVCYVALMAAILIPIASQSRKPNTVSENAGIITDEDLQIELVPKNDAYYRTNHLRNSKLVKSLWLNLKEIGGYFTLSSKHVKHSIGIPFDFTVYGVYAEDIEIDNGLIYFHPDQPGSSAAPVPYIAPLMSKLNFSNSDEVQVHLYHDRVERSFTVQWNITNLRVPIYDVVTMNLGNLSYQVTLHKNGDIAIVYKSIPNYLFYHTERIVERPVGADLLGEASASFSRRKKEIWSYEYATRPKNDTAIYMTPLYACNQFKYCWGCLADFLHLDCLWQANNSTCVERPQYIERPNIYSRAMNNTSVNSSLFECPKVASPPRRHNNISFGGEILELPLDLKRKMLPPGYGL